MNRNTYSSFQEAMKFRYNATNEDIQILLSKVPELEQNWNNYGKSHLLNIDLALFFGIKFENIVLQPEFLRAPTKINFAKYKLAILANPDLDNFDIDINYINAYHPIDDIVKTMNAILMNSLPHGYDIFKDISEVSSDLNMDIKSFSVKYNVGNPTSFINKQFKTYFPEFYQELMYYFPEFNVQTISNQSNTLALNHSEDIPEKPKEDPKIIRRKEFKAKLKELYSQPSRAKRGKLTLSTTNLDNFCYSTDKKFHHETKQRIKEKQLKTNETDIYEEQNLD